MGKAGNQKYNSDPLTYGMSSKGQLISECPFEILDFPKIPKKIDRFLPQNLKSGQIIR